MSYIEKLRMNHDVHIAEFNALRSEIDSRAQNSGNLLIGVIAATGAAIVILNSLPEILLAIAAVTSFAWIRWLDHHVQIFKIATYIAIDLSNRVLGGFYWEGYVRDLQSGDKGKAGPALNLTDMTQDDADALKTGEIRWFVKILFGALPLISLVAYSRIAIYPYYFGSEQYETKIAKVRNVAPENSDLEFLVTVDSSRSELTIGARWLAAGGVASLLIYSWHVYNDINKAVKVLDKAITERAPNRPDPLDPTMDNDRPVPQPAPEDEANLIQKDHTRADTNVQDEQIQKEPKDPSEKKS